MQDGRGMDEMRDTYADNYSKLYGVTPDVSGWDMAALVQGISDLADEASFATGGDDTAWFDEPEPDDFDEFEL